MRIDGRKTEQDFYYNGKRIYCWKNKDRSYSVGINGTNLHYVEEDKHQAEDRILFIIRRLQMGV